WLSVTDRLALDNLARSPGRTGLVLAAVSGGVALLLLTAGVIRSNEEAVRTWVDRCVAGDLFVTAGGPLSASGQTLAMHEAIGGLVAKEIPGAVAVPMSFRYLDWQQGKRSARILLVALDAASYFAANQKRQPPLPDLDFYRRLSREPGTALVSENFAALHGLK